MCVCVCVRVFLCVCAYLYVCLCVSVCVHVHVFHAKHKVTSDRHCGYFIFTEWRLSDRLGFYSAGSLSIRRSDELVHSALHVPFSALLAGDVSFPPTHKSLACPTGQSAWQPLPAQKAVSEVRNVSCTRWLETRNVLHLARSVNTGRNA